MPRAKGCGKEVALARKYILEGYGISGSKNGKKAYAKAVRHIRRGAKYGNLHYEYRWGGGACLDLAHHYLLKEASEHGKAMKLLRISAEQGCDMAVMLYAFFKMMSLDESYAPMFLKIDENEKRDAVNELMTWIEKADALDFAPAAYMLAIIYRDGYHTVERKAERAAHYLARFESLKYIDERQAVISKNIPVYFSDPNEMKQLSYWALIAWLV